MDTNTIQKITNQFLEVVRIARETATTVEQFREQIAARAMAGDLDDSYSTVLTLEELRERYIKNG